MEGLPLGLDLPLKETALLAITFLVGALTLGGGCAKVLQGTVHLALFAAFLFLTVIPKYPFQKNQILYKLSLFDSILL